MSAGVPSGARWRISTASPFSQSEVRITRRYRRYGGYSTRRTRVQTQRLVRVWLTGAALLLALLAAAAALLLRGGERPRFEKGELLVCVNEGGDVELYWPEAASADMYQLEYQCGGTSLQRYCSRPAALLSGLPEGEELHVRVRAEADRGAGKTVQSWKTLKADLLPPRDLSAPKVSGSPEAGMLRWTGEGEYYQVFRTDARSSPGAAGSVPAVLTRETGLSLPSEDGLSSFTVRACWKRRGFMLCGPASAPVRAGGPSLPSGGEWTLTYREAAPRLYVLEWQGTQCAYFEVRQYREEAWRTLARLAPEEAMRYDTGRLRSGSCNRFRVAAMMEDGTELHGEEITIWASISTLYSTVWPIQSLTLFESPGTGERLASVPGGTALCVLAEEDGWFRVRFQEEYGWVDSRFCMINLPEYVGDHCSYDITNSYDSLFAVHGAPIRDVTHEVLPGYEDMRTADGAFLVPYLYPCAKKLLTAAGAAEADGLRLKIYEAFRPQRATRFSYDTTEKQLNDPAQTESGECVTLSRLMTDNGRFSLGSFLARTISSHNRGIALDLTLEDVASGEELTMQSVIHDLSWYSETYLDNLNAKLLEGYMTAVGMNGLSSEWWHFQDDETKKNIGLNASLYEGVSPEGWTQDDGGWRYRQADGSFLRSTSATVDGRLYTFDNSGYATG